MCDEHYYHCESLLCYELSTNVLNVANMCFSLCLILGICAVYRKLHVDDITYSPCQVSVLGQVFFCVTHQLIQLWTCSWSLNIGLLPFQPSLSISFCGVDLDCIWKQCPRRGNDLLIPIIHFVLTYILLSLINCTF